jgi:hypothetical protein
VNHKLPPSHAISSRVQSMTFEARRIRVAPEGTAVSPGPASDVATGGLPPIDALRSRAPTTSGYRRSLDLLAEASLVPAYACTPMNLTTTSLLVRVPLHLRSTASTKTPSPRGSEQRPATRRLVSYRLDTRRTLRKTGGPAVLQRRPNLGRPHRSARSALGVNSFARTVARRERLTTAPTARKLRG